MRKRQTLELYRKHIPSHVNLEELEADVNEEKAAPSVSALKPPATKAPKGQRSDSQVRTQKTGVTTRATSAGNTKGSTPSPIAKKPRRNSKEKVLSSDSEDSLEIPKMDFDMVVADVQTKPLKGKKNDRPKVKDVNSS